MTMSNQNNNGHYYNMGQYSNYPNGHQQQPFITPQQMYMQYPQQHNQFNLSPGQIPQPHQAPLDTSNYQNYRQPHPGQKVSQNIPQSHLHVQKPTSWPQAHFQPGMSITPSQQQNMNFVQYDNLPYKQQYQNKTDPPTPLQTFQPPNLQKQKLSETDHLNARQAFEYLDNQCAFTESTAECNTEIQQFQYGQPMAKGKPIDMLINIDREISKERCKLRECVSEDCRLVLGEVQKLEGPFMLYNINGSNYYSIREVLAHLLPYHMYNVDLTPPEAENINVKTEKTDFDAKPDVPTTSEIDKLRSRIDALSNSEDPSTIWNCYKSIASSLIGYNHKTNDLAHAPDEQVGASLDVQQMNRPRAQHVPSYPRRMNYMQYMGNNICPPQPHNNTQ